MKRLALGLLVAVIVGCLPPPPTAPPTPTPEPTATLLPTATPTLPPTVAPGRTPSPTARPIPTATPTVGRLRWVIREAELNEAVVKALTNADTGGLGFRDPRVDLQPGQIVVNGRVTVAVFPVPIQVVIVVPVRDGQATPTIAAVRLGPRDAGEPIRRAVEALLAPHLAQLVAVGQGVFVETVTITETEIRIEGRPRRP